MIRVRDVYHVVLKWCSLWENSLPRDDIVGVVFIAVPFIDRSTSKGGMDADPGRPMKILEVLPELRGSTSSPISRLHPRTVLPLVNVCRMFLHPVVATETFLP